MFEMLYPLDLPLLVCLFSGEGPGHFIMNISPLNKVLFSNLLSQVPQKYPAGALGFAALDLNEACGD